jgi:oleate hydratase
MNSVSSLATPRFAPNQSKIYLVGAGIASLAAAAILIRDADARGSNITILEESRRVGGSLDAAGTATGGYTLRGGRMFESKYLCTFDLFDSIPTLDGRWTVSQEIAAWNQTLKTSSKSRLVREGVRQIAPKFGLSEADIIRLERLILEPEALIGRASIADQFDAAFFETDFWIMWCTTFAFQPWHSAVEFKRYLVRFAHMVSGFDRLEGIMRTRYNQYDSLVRPLTSWLEARGVTIAFDACVTDIHLADEADGVEAVGLAIRREGVNEEIKLGPRDYVFVTLGSMTEGSSLGTGDRPAPALGKTEGGAWALWESLAKDRTEFGRPGVFCDHIGQSKWISFTVTLREPDLLHRMTEFTGNVPGEGGLVTFPESPWLASIVVPFQPHFIGQSPDVSVFWGYGLSVDAVGAFVAKPMSDCGGAEIMTEILGHLNLHADRDRILATSTCIPCLMPFITSQFLPRTAGDRPDPIPKGSVNLGLMGQFCELPEDVVFTVEYSIRSAQTAVAELLNLKRRSPPVYKGALDPRVVYQAFRALHDLPV